MERKIGEIFRAGGHAYQCVENDSAQPYCVNCDMLSANNCVASLLGAGECIAANRSDKKFVRFIECKFAIA